MSRLCDYVVISGYDHTKSVTADPKQSNSEVIQRFPVKDWPDVAFSHGIERFCQPDGWQLCQDRQEPKFFVFILTDAVGTRLFCACLSFHEAVSREKLGLKEGDDVEDDGQQAPMSLVFGRAGSLPRPVVPVPGVSLPGAGSDHTVMFAPKCLALVSRHDLPHTFRNCLGLLYTAYIERLSGPTGEQVRLEELIGNLLGGVRLPSPGSPAVKFSLGASDRQVVRPPIHPLIPASGARVALLFQQLGIRAVLDLFAAVLTEQKIIFHSQSFSRLTDSCAALVSLIYPMRYSHTLVPVMPAFLLDYLYSPTPYIFGFHSQHQAALDPGQLLDVITVDLDGGMIHIPENLTLQRISEPLLSAVVVELSLVLTPELYQADLAFQSDRRGGKPVQVVDKELRAVMLRLVTQLLQGYRSCLTLVRIHPRPFITFHRAAFLGLRGGGGAGAGQDCIARFLDCMFFQEFITARGPPWRSCDIFDDLYSEVGEQLSLEQQDSNKILQHIEALGRQLLENESGEGGAAGAERIPLPTDGHLRRVHQPVFPSLDPGLVASVMEEAAARCPASGPAPTHHRLVPMGQRLVDGTAPATLAVPNCARRLEVLRTCISNIFDNKIADAKKTFPAVLRALKSKSARLALCEELGGLAEASGSQKMLEHQQFDMVVRLVNAALKDDSDIDMHGVAAAIIPISDFFGRKLCPVVTQHMYTLIQDHAVWQNLQFWEAAFYNDVQSRIKDLYMGLGEGGTRGVVSAQLSVEKHVGPRARELRKSGLLQPGSPSVLEIAATEIRKSENMEETVRRERGVSEEQTVYSQAIHYSHKMVQLLIPMDFKPDRNGKSLVDHSSDLNTNSISNSMADTDSLDAESGFDDTEPNDNGLTVIKFVTRFVDKVCGDASVSDSHLKSLHQMVPGVVAMQLETMEGVSREAKRLPPIQKPKFHLPTLLAGEETQCDPLRVYLLSDGREEYCGGGTAGPVLLPAEGALFLTNYRLIFRGSPIDPFSNEHIVSRAFPVTSLTREKRFTLSEYVNEIDQTLKEGIQMRSNTAQLIRAAFDDEVTAEEITNFRSLIHKTQYPPTLWHRFAFRGHIELPAEPLSQEKDKNAKYSTIRGLAKSTMKSVGKATGIKSKSKTKAQKYLQYNPHPVHGRLSVSSQQFREEEELSEVGGGVEGGPGRGGDTSRLPSLDRAGLEKLGERRYCQDWARLGLGQLDPGPSRNQGGVSQAGQPTRISTVNHRYAVSRSLPGLLVVPGRVTDESLRRVARVHKQCRLPVVTWRHLGSRALLLRGASYHARGMMGILRRHGGDPGSHGHSEVPVSMETEQFLAAVIAASPAGQGGEGGVWSGLAGSTTSLASLAGDQMAGSLNTPTLSRRNNNPFSKAMEGFGTLTRSSGGKSGKPFGGRLSLSSMGKRPGMGSQTSLTGSGAIRGPGPGYRSSLEPGEGEQDTAPLQRAQLYIFGEKSQVKGVKLDAHTKADFIPVDYPEPRRLRASFKKLMQAVAPSAVVAGSSASEKTFHRLVEASEWLELLQSVIQLAGAVTDLMDIQGSSVMLCLEDGWDLTCQVSSLAQLCLDPYYRTLEGFRTLVEKEWVAFGHRFNHRSNLDNSSQDGGFTPIFLQFLDIVHQLHNQFPMAFEFSQFYLRFLAYHHTSCRFRTFLLDSEFQQTQLGFTETEKKNSLGSRHQAGEGGSSEDEAGPGGLPGSLPGSHLGISVFDYIDRASSKSPVFHNSVFCPELQQSVLRPFSHLSDLVLWDHYTREELRFGPSFDLELPELEAHRQEEAESLTEMSGGGNRSLTNGYDCVVRDQPDALTALLRQVEELETELGHLPARWHQHWATLEPPPAHPPPPPPGSHGGTTPPAQVTTPSMYARDYGRSVHKRSTIELLLRGKNGIGGGGVGEGGGGSYTHPHRFEKYNYTAPAYCDLCNSVLWGIVRTGYRCQDCGLNCHEKCRENVPKACTKYKSVARDPTQEQLDKYGGERPGFGPSDSIHHNQWGGQQDIANITCQGYLYKRGALLKAWKQRWFVLDTIKHQLRYYDTREDFHCKGSIDLSEVRGVSPASSVPPGAPKKTDERCFFDLQTVRRTYSLCGESRAQAAEWMEKIQNCL